MSAVLLVLRSAPVLALMFSGCTCSSTPPPVPTPTATTRPAATATPVPPPTETAVPPTATAEAAPPTQAPAPAAAAPADPAKLAACKSYVEVLSGRKKDAALLGKKEVRAIATPDLVMCGAVLSDSDVLCKQVMPGEGGPVGACLQMQAIFHEMRAYPETRSFMFSEADHEECRKVPALTAFCDSMQKALRAGKPEDCAQTGDGESVCRAYMNADPSLCSVKGKLAEVEFSLPSQKEGEPKTWKVSEVAAEGCKQNIESRAFLAKGLKAVAESGPEREREFAKAALQQPDACQKFADAALQNCLGSSP